MSDATAITVLGGVGLFLLGMTVMTDGLKALAGSSLAHGARQGGGDAALGRLLGRDRHAARAIVERGDDDDDRPRQRRAC